MAICILNDRIAWSHFSLPPPHRTRTPMSSENLTLFKGQCKIAPGPGALQFFFCSWIGSSPRSLALGLGPMEPKDIGVVH